MNAPAPREMREVVITRVLDAPRELVFKAWTDPKMVQQWWGPTGFTNPVCEVDGRLGGHIRIHMRAPTGETHPMKGVFTEFAPPEKIVFTNIALGPNGEPILDGMTTVTFEAQGDKTKVTMSSRATAVVPEAVKHLQGMEMGWSLTLDRLTNFVNGPKTDSR